MGTPSSNLCTSAKVAVIAYANLALLLPNKLFCFSLLLPIWPSTLLSISLSVLLPIFVPVLLYCCLSAQLSKCIAVYLHCCQSAHFLPTCPLSLPILLSANLPNCQLDFCNLEICWTSTHLKNPLFLVAIWIPLANFPFNLNILVNRRY